MIESTHTANLNISTLPTEATQAHLFPDLDPTSLVSIDKLCDAGCEALFRSNECHITIMGDTILSGKRNLTTNGLWQLHPPSTKHQANAITTPSATPADCVMFAHAALFSPTLSTLRKALQKKYINNFPGLIINTLTMHPPNAVATAKGHMKQKRKGIQSTKTNTPLPLFLKDDNFFPPQQSHRTNACFTATIEPTGKTFSDLTGKFILPSRTGNN